MTEHDTECPGCGSPEKSKDFVWEGFGGNARRCKHPWHTTPSSVPAEPSVLDKLARAEMDEGLYDRVPAEQPEQELQELLLPPKNMPTKETR